jgi:glycosyltransferase involved in cell wall biosynthesis
VRVLVVTVVHTPLDARIHHRQIRAMREERWSVTYAAPWRAAGVDPAGVADGVRTRELPRAVGRRRLAALRSARRLLAVEGPRHDLVLLHDPELVLAVAGLRRRLPPVVLDVHEDLAASLTDRPWIPGWLRPAARAFARLLEHTAERRVGILLAEQGYAERFSRPHPVIRNLPPLPPVAPDPGGDRVVYVGRVSVGRGARELIALGAALSRDGVRVEVVGEADADVRDELARAHADGRVVWHGWLPNDRALEIVAGSLAGLSLLRDLPNYRVSLPTKVVEYLAAGVPAITTPLPEAVRLVEQAEAGRVVPFGDVRAVVEAVRDLKARPDEAAAMGRRGRDLVAEAWTWDAEQERFRAALRDAARPRRAAA